MLSSDKAASLGIELVSLDELFARADAITIHAPLTPETKNLIGDDAIAKMKKGVLIVNAARGGIVDERALAKALDRGPRRRRRARRVREGAGRGRQPAAQARAT